MANRRSWVWACLGALWLVAGQASAAEVEKSFSNPSQSGYSGAVVVEANGVKTIYVSGQVGIANGTVPADFAAQVDLTFANVARQLTAVGASMDDVVRITGYIVGLDSERNRLYTAGRLAHFTAPGKPASTLIGVAALVRPDMLVEVDAIAIVAAE